MVTMEMTDGVPFEGMSTFDITLARDGKSIHCKGVMDFGFPEQEELEEIFEEWERLAEQNPWEFVVTEQ